MNKYLVVALVVIVFGAVGVLSYRFFLSGPEDTWLCENGEWIKHGNPSAPMPETGCGGENDDRISYENSELGIKFNYPKGWYYEEREYDSGETNKGWTLSFYKTDETFYSEDGIVPGVRIEIGEWGYSTLEEAKVNSYSYTNSLSPHVEELKLDNEDAVLINSRELLVMHDSKTLSITIDASPDPPVTSAERAFELIISTFEFLR